MLYNPTQPSCALCQNATGPLSGKMICCYRGPVDLQFHCHKYCYDILKRQPKRAPRGSLPDSLEIRKDH